VQQIIASSIGGALTSLVGKCFTTLTIQQVQVSLFSIPNIEYAIRMFEHEAMAVAAI